MFLKKKKDNSDITLEWLIEVGVPPVYASIIIKRIDELLEKNKKKRKFKSEDFNTIPIWPHDREKLAKTLNKALE